MEGHATRWMEVFLFVGRGMTWTLGARPFVVTNKSNPHTLIQTKTYTDM